MRTDKRREERKVAESLLRRRTRRSFLVAGVGAALGASAWAWLLRQPEELGIPWPFRRVLDWNGRLSREVFDPERMRKPPPAPAPGTRPRLNGDLGLEEEIDPEAWRLRVLSAGAAGELQLSMNDIRSLPKAVTTAEFECIEGWSEIISYAGVGFSDFLRIHRLGRREGDKSYYPYVGLETPDRGYYVSIDTESMLHPQTILAYEMNGRPLAPSHGAPLRLIIPVKYGIKSLKRVGRIFFSETRPPDYWAEQGYDWFAGL